MIRTISLIAAVSLASIAAPGFANSGTDARRVTINVADLNLAITTDRARLDTRLRATISSLCRPGSHAIAEQLRARQCRNEAFASVAPQVDRAVALAQRHQRLASLDMPAVR